MLPGIICTIKIGKLCRCYCLSRGINACILIFSAAGSCWIPSGWFSHPPGTPVTASAHTEICKTFFSWCQHHYSGKVRTLYWITGSTKCDTFPSGIPAHLQRNGTFGWERCNILSDLSIHCCQSLLGHGHVICSFKMFSSFAGTSKDRQGPYTPRVHLAHHGTTAEPVHLMPASSYFLTFIFQKFPLSMPGQTETCRWTALTIAIINTELPCHTQVRLKKTLYGPPSSNRPD